MASRLSSEPLGRPDQVRPEPGQTLLVVQLIERDDDFGDGWYLGRNLVNGNSGLFPEVYTRIAPPHPANTMVSRSYPANTEQPAEHAEPTLPAIMQPAEEEIPKYGENRSSISTVETDHTPQPSRHTSASEFDPPSITSPLNPSTLDDKQPSTTKTTTLPIQPKAVSMISATTQGQDSPVMNETLSVIDEHITDMNSPHHSLITAERKGTNDSGSEYSSHLDHRMSYINGEETDDEEEDLHTKEEVEGWTPDQVAEYLFTTGVESKHCEVFRDQEITGDVVLGMDQSSVFLKEFDLGSVGRRLKTWQKIKALQDEVNGETSTRRNTGTYGSDVGSEDNGGRTRSRSNTATKLPRIPSLMERPGSRQNSRFSQQINSKNEPTQKESPVSPKTKKEKKTETSHKKQPSFDRNWTMGGSASPSMGNRPISSTDLTSTVGGSSDHLSQLTVPTTNLEALDRGYFSGGDVEGRSRNVLRKRGSTTSHSRNSSYTDEQRLRSGTTHSRHSRFGSVDSMRGSTPPSASQKYYGLSVNGRRRTPSENSINTPPRPLPPPKDITKDITSPTVTRLDGGAPHGSNPGSPRSPIRQVHGSDWLLPVKSSSSRHFGLRAISDAVTGNEKTRVASPENLSPRIKESPMQSPTRTGSSTPSGGGQSFDLESPDTKSASSVTTPASTRGSRKKSKKETSAYTRGLEKKTPQEQMIGADYSGWMKKKSTNLMTTWKPRLFILKGRRLSYYYSEDDQQEKGLIDISFHRVLPADNDRLTGLHATLTGATNSPTSPAGAHTATKASTEAAAEPDSTLSKGAGDSMFIFKLVPPRAGFRAVTFTKPTVHYFAVPNIKQGRLWMAALMKATIDRDDTKAITTTYQQKTISLAKARQMRHRPPALMNLDEHIDEEAMKTPASDRNGLNIQGIVFDRETHEGDSGVSGVSKTDDLHKSESAKSRITFEESSPTNDNTPVPQTA
ncbi:hypothetical protein B7494_g820 [Chlorociboria aeruginascens]|nr:hypothetical protein B7494_g820 [Chlorociboria aeruginascens]